MLKSLEVSNFCMFVSFSFCPSFLTTSFFMFYKAIRIQIRPICCNWLCAFSYLFLSFFNLFAQEVLSIPCGLSHRRFFCWLHPQGIIQHVPLLLTVNWTLNLGFFYFLERLSHKWHNLLPVGVCVTPSWFLIWMSRTNEDHYWDPLTY